MEAVGWQVLVSWISHVVARLTPKTQNGGIPVQGRRSTRSTGLCLCSSTGTGRVKTGITWPVNYPCLVQVGKPLPGCLYCSWKQSWIHKLALTRTSGLWLKAELKSFCPLGREKGMITRCCTSTVLQVSYCKSILGSRDREMVTSAGQKPCHDSVPTTELVGSDSWDWDPLGSSRIRYMYGAECSRN